MLRLDHAGKSYRRHGHDVVALRPTSLEISAGEFVAIVGPSGSGKTTLMSMLGGMLAPSQGRALFEGQSLYELPISARARLRRDRIGFVFQTFNLIPYLTALENVQAPLYLAGITPEAQEDRALQLLGRLGLGDRVDHKPSELSTGQQQRVALARTLANDPAVILADEPTGNLDPDSRQQILALLGEFNREGRTIVMVTHDMEAARHARRVLHVAAGEVLAPSATATEVLATSATAAETFVVGPIHPKRMLKSA